MPHHVAIARSATKTIGRRYSFGWTRGSRGGSVMRAVASRVAFDDHRDRIAATETERREPMTRTARLERPEQRRQHARAARADRVTERDRAAADVHGVRVEPERADRGDRHDGEGLVD